MREMAAGGTNISQDGQPGTPSQDMVISPSTHDMMQGVGADNEDEKERTIAKAALSIAELGAFLYCHPSAWHNPISLS